MTKHFVAWSGGLDSTLVLKTLLDEGIEPKLLSFIVPEFGQEKVNRERVARQRILDHFKKDLSVSEISLSLPFGYQSRGEGTSVIQQPLMLSHSAFVVPNDSIIHFGYHVGDSYFSFEPLISKAVESILLCLGDKKIRYSFPLRFLSKPIIVERMDNAGLTNLCHWCEKPSYHTTECECIPCYTMKESRLLLDQRRRDHMVDIGKIIFDFPLHESINEERKWTEVAKVGNV